MPMMHPTTAWDVDTGSLKTVISVTVRPAETATMNAVFAVCSVRPDRVCIPSAPWSSAPKITNTHSTNAAVLKRYQELMDLTIELLR